MSGLVERLRACPFCGNEAPTQPIEQGNGSWRIWCHDCGIYKSAPTERYAITAWNTRASDPLIEQLVEALFNLAITTAKLVAATDGQEPIRPQRLAALEAVKVAETALSAARGETGE